MNVTVSNAHRRTRRAYAVPPRVCALLLLLASATVVLPACSSDGEKKSGSAESGGGDLTLRRVDFDGGSFNAVDLTVIVAVKNATSSDLKISGGDVEVAILRARDSGTDSEDTDTDDADSSDGDDEAGTDEASDDDEGADDEAQPTATVVTGVFQSGTGNPATVPPDMVAEYPLRLTFELPDDPAELEALLAWKHVVLDIKGSVNVGGATETFAGERELALPEYPVIVVNKAQVASENSGQNGSAFFVIGIENPNVFNLDVDAFAWGIKINGKELEPIGAGSPEQIPPSTVTSFEDTVQLTTETYGPDVQALLSQPSISYEVNAYIEVSGIRREQTFTGEMAFPR